MTIMGWRGLPPPQGGGRGRWVVGTIMGWRALLPAGGVLWDVRMPHKAGGGAGEEATIMGWLGPAAVGGRGRKSIMGWHHLRRL